MLIELIVMRKSTFITRLVWDSLDRDLRKAILIKTELKRTDIINKMFVSKLEDELRIRGEHELANMLTDQEVHNNVE